MAIFSEFFSFFLSTVYGLFFIKEKNPSRLENRDILILPGLGSGTWFYRKLESTLKTKGYRPFTVPLPPWRSEKVVIATLNQYLSQARSKTIVIAHNTSGLLMGALPDETRRKVDTLITLGTPFYGFRLMNIFTWKGWEPKSSKLAHQHPAYLFINQFYPLAPIRDILFQPKDCMSYGQARDQWFDVPGNYNMVRSSENLRTLGEFLISVMPPIPQMNTIIPAHMTIQMPSEKATPSYNPNQNTKPISKNKNQPIGAKNKNSQKKQVNKINKSMSKSIAKKKSKKK
jgi:hypothetical protein